VIVSGSIIGSGEILLTSSLGAVAGFVMLWWVLVACWSKSIVQAELARYIITSGDTYLRALNRIPGRIRGPNGPISWPLILGLIAFIPGVTGTAGIIGGAGQALTLLTDLGPVTSTALVALGTTAILWTGSYLRLERTMLGLVMSFTAITIICAGLMQFTDNRMTLEDVASGFTFEFPVEFAVLALAMYGYTGVNSGETSAYMYWCVEKGYPSYIGADRTDPDWVHRAKGWIRVLQTDVWATLIILTLATVPFYLLGAGVLHRNGLSPQGLETISVLSGMFTATLGGWSLWLFGIGAFFILFSTSVSGIGAGGRFLPEYAIEFGFVDRSKVQRRLWIRAYTLAVPIIAFLLYLFFQSPVFLVTIAATVGAMMLPIQSGVTIYFQHARMDPRVKPGWAAALLLKLIFIFQLLMAAAVLRFTVFGD
jgi:Mn2+/Fe2+ NRAMP family transporter